MVVLARRAFGCLSGCAVGVCTCFGSGGGLALSSRRTGRSTPERFEPLTSVSQHFNAGLPKSSVCYTAAVVRKMQVNPAWLATCNTSNSTASPH